MTTFFISIFILIQNHPWNVLADIFAAANAYH